MLSRRSFVNGLIADAARAAPPSDPADMTVDEAMSLLQQRRITPGELTRACLRRIERLNPRLNAIITVLGDQALAEAKTLRPQSATDQPLHGIPIAFKDLFDTAGVRTTAASAQWHDRVPSTSATVVRRLRSAGAVMIAKANMDEFAYNFTSETSVFGPGHNPWHTDFSPGGSSGGSAIAVGTGMSLAALGSDTGGSIRLPASFCGITGFKPTYGRVPADGVTPLAWSLDHVGPMTRTARDAALVHGILSGHPVQLRPAKDLRLGLAREPYWQALDGDVDRAMEKAIRIMRRFARDVRDLELPALPEVQGAPLPKSYATVIYSEAYAFHREMLARHPDRYNAGTRASIELGRSIPAADYILDRQEMQRLRATATAALFKDADVLITPTSPGPAFRLESRPSLIFLRNTAPWNLYGLPTISIPCGFSSGGLPIGLQITGAPGRDDTVISLAAEFQAQTDYHLQRPSVK